MTTSAPSIDREEGPAALGRRLAKHYRRVAQRTVEEARIRGFAFTTMPPEGLEALAAEAQRWGFVVTFEMRRGFAQAMVRAGSPSGTGRARRRIIGRVRTATTKIATATAATDAPPAVPA
jgi:hypothetical protein